ncbi:hypothetical protein PoMZ_08201, partial [Pyricularia oryzae]
SAQSLPSDDLFSISEASPAHTAFDCLSLPPAASQPGNPDLQNLHSIRKTGHRRQPSAMLKCQPPARHPPSDGDFCAGKMDTF